MKNIYKIFVWWAQVFTTAADKDINNGAQRATRGSMNQSFHNPAVFARTEGFINKTRRLKQQGQITAFKHTPVPALPFTWKGLASENGTLTPEPPYYNGYLWVYPIFVIKSNSQQLRS